MLFKIYTEESHLSPNFKPIYDYDLILIQPLIAELLRDCFFPPIYNLTDQT